MEVLIVFPQLVTRFFCCCFFKHREHIRYYLMSCSLEMRPVLYFSNGFQRGFYLLNCREYQVYLKEAFIGKTAFAVPALIVAGGLLFTPLQRKCFFTCGVHWGEAFLLLSQMVAGIYLPNDRKYQMFIWQKRQFERRPLQLFPELVSGDLDLSNFLCSCPFERRPVLSFLK